MLYALARPLLFSLDPETAHEIALTTLDSLARAHLAGLGFRRPADEPVTVMGLTFANRVGLAAGLDKNARYVDALSTFGFGHIECGTVTPRPQPGNARPRLFRLEAKSALINRMGFNNQGLAAFLGNVARTRWKGILGLNIGKNFDTSNENAHEDYLTCLRGCYAHAAYVTVNVSSPNTKGLRDLQQEDALERLAARLKAEQARLADQHGKYTPVVLKVAPDLNGEAIEGVARVLVRHGVDGVIATNTTLSREGVAGVRHADESGGLSGAPLRELSTKAIRTLARALDGAVPIVGVGGILSGDDAREKLDAGASLVQIYTGFIYRGPGLVAECVQATRAGT